MKPWLHYCEDVEKGRILTGLPIKQAVKRFREFSNRDDMYFDTTVVEECIQFIHLIRHFLGKSAGKHFKLEDWQAFIIANIFGFKWKSTGYRVCREVYIQIARKAGKDAFAAAIVLYLLVAEGEASPEVCCAANSVDQARILFEYITKFSKSIDDNGDVFKTMRNCLKCPSNGGVVNVISADPSRADGKNLSAFVLDEFHEARDRKMFDVLASSQGQREQPLAIIITTAGFDLNGPCHDMYEFSKQVLGDFQKMDNFFPFIWELDADDDWSDPRNFIKAQPNLGVTVTEEFMSQEVNKAKVDPTAMTGVLTKTLNRWVQTSNVWIPQEVWAKYMEKLELEDFEGYSVVLGCDLSSVNDFSSISIMAVVGDKYYFKTWCFLPEETFKNSPNQKLYEKFVNEGTMILTPGNVIDYQFIIGKIGEISRVCNINACFLDKWNATQIQIELTERGFNVVEFSQSIGNYNACTKEFQRLLLSGKMVIDKSACVLWQAGNVFLKQDFNGNQKPSKESYSKKIDSIISMTTALGGYMMNPVNNDFNIFVL